MVGQGGALAPPYRGQCRGRVAQVPERGCVGPPTSRSNVQMLCFPRIHEARFHTHDCLDLCFRFGQHALEMRLFAAIPIRHPFAYSACFAVNHSGLCALCGSVAKYQIPVFAYSACFAVENLCALRVLSRPNNFLSAFSSVCIGVHPWLKLFAPFALFRGQ